MLDHTDMTHVAIPYQLPGNHMPDFQNARKLLLSTEKPHKHIEKKVTRYNKAISWRAAKENRGVKGIFTYRS